MNIYQYHTELDILTLREGYKDFEFAVIADDSSEAMKIASKYMADNWGTNDKFHGEDYTWWPEYGDRLFKGKFLTPPRDSTMPQSKRGRGRPRKS